MTLVHCRGLSHRYGRTPAIDNLDLTLDAGGPVALVGANGAGKTTLLSLLCGYLRPHQGSLSVLGHSPGSRALLGRLAALPQDARLDPRFSIARQLRLQCALLGMGRAAARDESARVLAAVDLADCGRQRPEALSHGMRKRVALAQALIGSPELILLDEPTAGIDPPNVRVIRDLIHEQASTVGFIISSHNLAELERLCTRVISLERGRLVEMGPIDRTDADEHWLTIHVEDIDDLTLHSGCQGLAGVLEMQSRGGGVWLIRHDGRDGVDRALLARLAARSWRYRYLINGRGLEERLFR